MEKKLPKVFVNKIDKPLTNNKSVFYSEKERDQMVASKPEEKKSEKSMYWQLQDLFRDVPFIYRKEVSITLKDKVLHTKIASYNQTYLLTLDNTKIMLNDIVSIEKKE